MSEMPKMGTYLARRPAHLRRFRALNAALLHRLHRVQPCGRLRPGACHQWTAIAADGRCGFSPGARGPWLRGSHAPPRLNAVPFAGGKIGITLTFALPHCEQTRRRCLGTPTKIMSFQSCNSSNVLHRTNNTSYRSAEVRLWARTRSAPVPHYVIGRTGIAEHEEPRFSGHLRSELATARPTNLRPTTGLFLPDHAPHSAQ